MEGEQARGMEQAVPTGFEAHYMPSQHVAVFYENATAATIMHEFFHHMVSLDLLTPHQKKAFETAFGVGLVGVGEDGYQEQTQAEERAADAFTRYLFDGDVTGLDNDIQTAFREIRPAFAHYADNTMAQWELKPDVAASFEEVLAATTDSSDVDANVGEAVARGMAHSKGHSELTVGKTTEGRLFHIWKGKLTRGDKMEDGTRAPGVMTEKQVRDSLSRNGHKAYLLAKDAPEGTQRADMTQDEAFAASEYLHRLALDLRPLLANEKAVQEATRRIERLDAQPEIEAAREELSAQPDADQTDAVSVGNPLAWAKRHMRNMLARNFATYWNVFKLADGYKPNGFFQRNFSAYFRKMERDFGSLRLEWDNHWNEYRNKDGFLVPEADVQVEVGGQHFSKGQLIGMYIFSEGGNPDARWMPTIYRTNKEVTPERVREVKRIVESDEGMKRFVKGWQALSPKILSKLQHTAQSMGHRDPGSLGRWYLPFTAEDYIKADTDGDALWANLDPDFEGGQPGRGGVIPAQIKARTQVAENVLDRMQESFKHRKGRLNLDAFELIDRYQRTSANYVSKAQTVKRMLDVLNDGQVVDLMMDKHGDGEIHSLMVDMVRRHAYVSGRTSQLNMGERALKWLRETTHGALLPHNPVVVMRQSGSFYQALAYMGQTPSDAAKLFALAAKGFSYKKGDSKAPRFYQDHALEGWEPYDRMVRYLPNMRYRYADPEIQDVARRNRSRLKVRPGDSKGMAATKKAAASFMETGMRPIQWVDAVIVSSVFNVSFDQKMTELSQHVEAGKMTPNQAESAAAEFAQEIVIKSQPPTDISERALGQTASEIIKAIIPFSGQRMKNWNAYVYDTAIPMFMDVSEAKGIMGKMAVSGQTVWDHKQMIGYAALMPALLFGLIARRRPPESWDEIFTDLITYPIGHIPMIGRWVEGSLRGWPADWSNATMYEAVASSARSVVSDLLGKEPDIRTANDVRSLLTMLTGFPDYPTRVIMRFGEDYFQGDREGLDRYLRIMSLQVADREDILNGFPENIIKDTEKLLNL